MRLFSLQSLTDAIGALALVVIIAALLCAPYLAGLVEMAGVRG